MGYHLRCRWRPFMWQRYFNLKFYSIVELCNYYLIQLLFSIGEGFPPGFEYRWAEGKEAVSCSGPEYVEKVMTWVEDEINNEATFPSTEGTPFPKTFQKILSSIFSRLFRIYAIIYTNFFTQIESVGAAAHLNTSFKHFMLFVWEFELVKDQEFEALKTLTDELKEKYHSK